MNERTEMERIVVHVEAYLERILPKYLVGRREEVVSLLEGTMPEDLDTIRVFGHRMKGTGGAYGLDAITEIGNTLEQAAIHQSTNEIEELLDSFLNYLDRLEVVYVYGILYNPLTLISGNCFRSLN